MKLNKKGNETFDFWQELYYEENDRLGGNSAEGDLVEGWCIIDNYDFIKTLADMCGLLVYGYDDGAVYHMEEYIEIYGENDVYFTDIAGNTYTAGEVKTALLEYFEKEG